MVNLQYGDVSEEIRLVKQQTNCDIVECQEFDKNDDLDSLSHLISACDYVVTIDNFIAHLAGALGVKTDVLLPFNSDWRWGANESSSYWYSSVNLVRQKTPKDWGTPLFEISRQIDN